MYLNLLFSNDYIKTLISNEEEKKRGGGGEKIITICIKH